MTPRFKAVMFDLDGTLLNTLEDIANATNVVLRTKGYAEHPLEAYKVFVGDGADVLLRRALPEGHKSDEAVEECLSLFRKEYGATCLNTARPYPGIPEVLNYLSLNKIKTSVFSNKPDVFTQRCVTQLMADWSFDCVAGAKDGIPLKPDPTGAFAVCEELGVKPEETLYVGDTDVDMKTAVSAGMYAVGAAWGFRPEDELLEGGAMVIAPQPIDLISILDSGE